MPPSKKPVAKVKTPPLPYPPIAVDEHEWKRRTQSPIYIHRIKRLATRANGYRLLVHGSAHLSRQMKNALHYFADTNYPGADDRRSRRLDTDTGNGEGTSGYTDSRGFGDAPVAKTA